MSQQLQPEGSNQLHDPPVGEQGLLVPDQVQTVSHKRSAEGLSVGGDSIADLIRKAKASRTAGDGARKVLENTDGASAGSGAVDTPMEESLESALSCPICSDYLYRPVAAIPCLHVFCGSCLVPWINRSSVCPNCRTRVTAVKDDHRTNNLLETYLKLHPEKARAEEDKADLDKIYKPGNVVKITRVAEDYSDEEDVRDEDEDDEDMEDWRQRQLEATRMHPCLCCDPPEPNVYGYACEHPIPAAPAPLDGAAYREGIEHHRRCNACQGSMPLREGMACESCSYNWCGSLLPCPRQGVLKKFERTQNSPLWTVCLV